MHTLVICHTLVDCWLMAKKKKQKKNKNVCFPQLAAHQSKSVDRLSHKTFKNISQVTQQRLGWLGVASGWRRLFMMRYWRAESGISSACLGPLLPDYEASGLSEETPLSPSGWTSLPNLSGHYRGALLQFPWWHLFPLNPLAVGVISPANDWESHLSNAWRGRWRCGRKCTWHATRRWKQILYWNKAVANKTEGKTHSTLSAILLSFLRM